MLASDVDEDKFIELVVFANLYMQFQLAFISEEKNSEVEKYIKMKNVCSSLF